VGSKAFLSSREAFQTLNCRQNRLISGFPRLGFFKNKIATKVVIWAIFIRFKIFKSPKGKEFFIKFILKLSLERQQLLEFSVWYFKKHK